MAKIFAKRAYDMTKYNFHKIGTTTELEGFEDKPYSVNKVVYQDRIEAVSDNGSAVVFAAPDFETSNGTFSGLFHSSSSKAKDVWAGMQGIKLDIDKLEAVWATPETSDDKALLRSLLAKADTFDLSNSADKANGYGGKDKMNGKGGNDHLWGGDGNDHIRGGSGNDQLKGQEGSDRIEAGSGKDTLDGGAGGDLLIGGKDGSRDVFVFNDWLDSMWGGDRDEIRNFTRKSDKIDLRGLDADENTEAHDDLHWSGREADGHAVWWKTTKGGVMIEADVSGDGLAEVQIFLQGVSSLGESDLLL